MLGQIEQLSADVQSGQAEEVSDIGWLDLRQRTVQAQQGVLEYVVGLLPAFQTRIVGQHPPCQPLQPLAGAIEQLAPSRFIARPQLIEPSLDQH